MSHCVGVLIAKFVIRIIIGSAVCGLCIEFECDFASDGGGIWYNVRFLARHQTRETVTTSKFRILIFVNVYKRMLNVKLKWYHWLSYNVIILINGKFCKSLSSSLSPLLPQSRAPTLNTNKPDNRLNETENKWFCLFREKLIIVEKPLIGRKVTSLNFKLLDNVNLSQIE